MAYSLVFTKGDKGMKWLLLRTYRGAGLLLGLIIVATLSLGLAAPAQAAKQKTTITASFDPVTGILTVTGDEKNNVIVMSRDGAGTILVNGGAVQIAGGPAAVTTTSLIEMFGLGKNDQLSIDEANGPLPAVRMLGGDGNDRLSGGPGGDQLLGEAGNDNLLGRGGDDVLSGGDDDDRLSGGPGGDRLLGEAGNDTIAWSRGDDGDLIEGGDGKDTIAATGGGDDEIFVATGDGVRMRLEQTTPSPMTLDIGTAESLVVNTGGGNDTFAAGPGLAPLINVSVDGGDGADAIMVSSSDDAEIFTVTADNGRVRFERADPTPYLLDIVTAETLELSTNGGDDRVAVGLGVDQLMRVTVDGQAMAAGDAIVEGDPNMLQSANGGITASFSPSSGILTVFGNPQDNAITLSRDAAGTLLVNGGAVRVTGGTPTIANTNLIQVYGQPGNDTISLDEANGALPKANLFGSSGDDTIIGGSGADQIFGQAGNDILLGKIGIDLLFGGADNDALTGGDGDDQAFGESGNDRLIWNPGDDTDLNEGGDGSDTIEVNGGGGAEAFTTTANGTRVRLDRLDPAPFALDIGTSEKLVLNANGGNDSFSATGNLAALIQITVDGGAGDDTLLGSNGADLLLGGDNNDFIDGQQGNDTAFLGVGDDTFQWDPGDGNDIVEGQDGADSTVFNGSNANEIFDISANGARVRFTRNIANIVMDIDDVETLNLNALGGTDTLSVNDLSGTDLTTVSTNLAGVIGGTTGDAAADIVIVNATNDDNTIDVVGAGTSASVVGLPAQVSVANSEGANDSLVVNALGGNDTVRATTVPAGIVKLTADGGVGDDTLLGSQGADVFLGGDGNDFSFGDNGNDVAFMGAGDDSFQWDPGDGNDTVEGQDGIDTLLFNGANVAENIDIVANGGRVIFLRNVANVTMDVNDIETVNFNALGGADNIIVGDVSGTDLAAVNLSLAGVLDTNTGDGQADTVTVNGTQSTDVIGISGSAATGVTVAGLPAIVTITASEGANDTLVVNALGGDDTVDASGIEANLIKFVANGGLGIDTITGSQSNDLSTGGDGNDIFNGGNGDDTFVWNPGDDNDTVEGQDGFDTLLFSGANIAENIAISANGERVRFTRDVAAVTIDLNDVEAVNFNALGGADTIAVNDLSGTDLTAVNLNLVIAGAGDAQPDTVIVTGTNGDDTILPMGDASGAAVLGLAVQVNITGAEAANDRLTINTLDGDDVVDASGLAMGAIQLTADGGNGADVLVGGAGNDTLLGGDGDDVLLGGPGVDVLDGGTGNNILIQD
jgi:Ca2+-binding RTX toxin-like protein